MRAKASKDLDDRGRKVTDGEGARLQRLWQCHLADDGPDDPPAFDALDEGAQAALDRANRVIGCAPHERPDGSLDRSGCAWSRCPGSYAREPDAYEVARLLPLFRKSQLQLVQPHPPAVLVDAIICAEGACNAREADDIQRAMKRKPEGT